MLNNRRFIYVLPPIVKLFDKAVLFQISEYCMGNKLLYEGNMESGKTLHEAPLCQIKEQNNFD